MNKASKLGLVVLLATTVAACDDKAGSTEDKKHIGQRDVYNSLEDCVADWADYQTYMKLKEKFEPQT